MILKIFSPKNWHKLAFLIQNASSLRKIDLKIGSQEKTPIFWRKCAKIAQRDHNIDPRYYISGVYVRITIFGYCDSLALRHKVFYLGMFFHNLV
jgi:hypothetical protein